MRRIGSFTAVASFLLCSGAVVAEPLKIALVESFSGPGGVTGVQFRDGFRFGIKKLNETGGYNGEHIAGLEFDSQSTAGGASDKLRAAIAEGARIIMVGGSSAIQARLLDDVQKHNTRNPGREVILFAVGGESYAFTAEKCYFWYYHYSSNSAIRFKALIPTMKQAGVLGKSVYLINQNYAYGVESQEAESEYSKQNGAATVGSVLHDMDKVQDFAPYVARIKASGADTVLTGNWGNDMILLLKAINSSGIKVQIGATNLDNPGVIGSAGPAALGAYQVSTHSPEAGGETGAKLNAEYKAAYGQLPQTTGYGSHMGLQFIGQALKSVARPDKSIDIKAIALAIEGAKLATPMGEVTMRREDHQAAQPIAVSVVAKGTKYQSDNTDMGLKLVRVVPGPEAIVPVDAACKMARPG